MPEFGVENPTARMYRAYKSLGLLRPCLRDTCGMPLVLTVKLVKGSGLGLYKIGISVVPCRV